MSVGTAVSRAAIVTWGAAGVSVCAVPDSAPAWVAFSLAGLFLSPVVALVAVWPFLLVRNLTEVPAPQPIGDGGQETRIQVLDGGDRR